MLIFISGSINSGKTTTCNALAKRLGAKAVNVDDLNDQIPNFNLATDLDKSMDVAIATINRHLDKGHNVVANYVLRKKDFDRFENEIHTKEQYIITLAPQLSVATSQRGDRVLSDWEVQRVHHHYKTGIASPEFGHIIDNSTLTVNQTVDRILEIIKNEKTDSSANRDSTLL
ncbi:ATP/GTP-binding protein [Candidatus Saccharibacteria bacterium]|nr:ATP/GTP-binding protein [Candidatus Saccharibacteria bacterium]